MLRVSATPLPVPLPVDAVASTFGTGEGSGEGGNGCEVTAAVAAPAVELIICGRGLRIKPLLLLRARYACSVCAPTIKSPARINRAIPPMIMPINWNLLRGPWRGGFTHRVSPGRA